jgi:hypothetical protein
MEAKFSTRTDVNPPVQTAVSPIALSPPTETEILMSGRFPVTIVSIPHSVASWSQWSAPARQTKTFCVSWVVLEPFLCYL